MLKEETGNQHGIIEAHSLKHAIVNSQRLATGSPIVLKQRQGSVIFIVAAYGTISALTEGGVETNLRPSGVLIHPLRFDADVSISGASLGIVYVYVPFA